MLSNIEIAKIKLMTVGMSVSKKARKVVAGESNKPLTLADYASTSGVSMELPNDVWVNAPIADYNPNFVDEKKTPYLLDFKEGNFILSGDNLEVIAKPVPVADYHEAKSSKGNKFQNFAITHTDRVRISPIEGCGIACQFCDLPYEFKYRIKNAGELVESVDAALKDKKWPAKHVLISGGTPRPDDFSYEKEVYRQVASSFPGVDVDVMMVPLPGLLDPLELKDMGIHGLSINLELFNPDLSKKYMHSKWKASREGYLDFIERAVKVFGEGKVRSLMLVGIEPMEDTMRGIEALAQLGCDPILSPFRPDPNTPLRNLNPPSIEFLIDAYDESKRIVSKYPQVKLGPRCIPCQHNTLSFPDSSGAYYKSGE